MIFNFLKYIKPIWYFNLKPKVDYCYFPTYQQLDQAGFQYSIDKTYKSPEAQQRDVAWTAFQQGFISADVSLDNSFWVKKPIPIADEYIFLRKNFNAASVLFVYLLRLITFNNPIRETAAFFKSRSVKRVYYTEYKKQTTDYNLFQSDLLKSNPLVTVIIPTLNRYEYLKDVLKDLESQTYTNFEVLVVDQTDNFKEEFYLGWNLNLRNWFQTEKALWRARNEAIQAAKGDYILLYDDDSRVESDWIEQHLKTLDYFKADISSGVSISVVGDNVPQHYAYFRWSDQIDTGNVLLSRKVFETIGLFDTKFEKQRMGDGEYGFRAYLAGCKNISNPFAKRIHLKVSQGGLRQMGSWDGWRPKKMLDPRPVPSVLYFARSYFKTNYCLLFIIISLPPSLIPYRWKKNKSLKIASFCCLPLLLPLILFQVIKSWQWSSKMMQSPSQITPL